MDKNYEEALGCGACQPGKVNSPQRLRLLRRTGYLKGTHPRLDRLTTLCARLLEVPVVLVSLVDLDRQVFASQTWLTSPWRESGETPLSHSFCQYVVEDGRPLIVRDARSDERLRDNRAIDELGVVAYAGFPVVCQQQILGSLCAIKAVSHDWKQAELELLGEFSEAVSEHIALKLECEEVALALENARRTNEELEHTAEILAHDLKSPLRGIRGNLYILEEIAKDDLSDEALEIIKDVNGSAKRMSTLIDGLSHFSNALHTSVGVTTLDLNQLVASVIKDLSVEINETKATVVVENDLGKCVGIKPLIRQLYQNLIANALKFQPVGQAPKITLGRRTLDGVFYVKDNGVGIPARAQSEIFQIYKRGPSTQGLSGMGLGLAICARIVSRHDGRIWVESEPGKGSAFFFDMRIPLGDRHVPRERRTDDSWLKNPEF